MNLHESPEPGALFPGPLHAKLLSAMRSHFSPLSFDFSEKCEKVCAIVRASLGFNLWVMQGNGELWLSFSENGNEVNPHWNPKTNTQDLSAAWYCFISVAGRGNFITCETATVTATQGKYNAPTPDTPPRPIAVEWTRRIGAKCDLTYVEAAPLRRWKVAYEEIDPKFCLDHSDDPPNAFQVIFHE